MKIIVLGILLLIAQGVFNFYQAVKTNCIYRLTEQHAINPALKQDQIYQAKRHQRAFIKTQHKI